MFIANTGEEQGLLGADYFANHPTVPIGKIVGVVDLDMPVPLYQFTDVIAFGGRPFDHRPRGRRVPARRWASRCRPIRCPSKRSSSARTITASSCAACRRSCCSLAMAMAARQSSTSSSPSIYHRLSDDLKQPILWDAAARYGELNYRVARQLADADAAPDVVSGDYFGDMYAPGSRAPALSPLSLTSPGPALGERPV